MLDELEALSIEMNDTLVPRGYNVFSGNQNVGGCRRAKKPRKRDGDADLPVYISSMTRNGKLVGYQVEDARRGRRRCFTDGKVSMQKKLEAARAFLKGTEEGVEQPKYKKPRLFKEDNDLPIGVYYTSGLKHGVYREGYLVQKQSGKPGREFCSSKLSLAEKRSAAVTYVGNAARFHNLIPKSSIMSPENINTA